MIRNDRKRLLIVIPVLNLFKEYTLLCLNSIKVNEQLYDYKILIIDNNSDNVNRNLLKEYAEQNKDKIDVIFNFCNIGVARSWNSGLLYAKEHNYDYVFIINNDVLFHPECINNLIEQYNRAKEQDDKVIVAFAVSICKNDNILARPEDIFSLNTDIRFRPSSRINDYSAFLVEPDIIEKVGMFDTNFYPAYFEDKDYDYRIKIGGYKFVRVMNALYYHYGSRTQKESIKNNVVCSSPVFESLRRYYISKWGGMPGNETFNKPFNK